MRFDSSAGQTDQQGRHQHLRYRHDVPRDRSARPGARHPNWKNRDGAAAKNGRPNMHMNLTGYAAPGARRDEESGHDSSEQLQEHQSREELVRVAINLFLVMLEQLIGAFGGRMRLSRFGFYFRHTDFPPLDLCSTNEQPNTNVLARSAA